ncbi:MAG: dual specificity protein phosphatase family protein [Planctomycetaceae bacterium]|nr:dual specificity protein phosphatase family protein [Planctomycetaceae bacterium]
MSTFVTTRSERFTRLSNQKKLVLGLLTIGMLAGTVSGIFWWKEHRYEYFPKRWGVVVPGEIYRSGQLTPQMLDKMLKKHSIHTVIDMQLNDLHDGNQQAEVQYVAEHGWTHHRFGLAGDGTGDVSSYVGALTTIVQCQKAGEPVLVHCAAGSQRTGGVVAFYRLLFEKADPKDVWAEMEHYDWNVVEDWELLEYINTNLPQIAQQLVERGVLDRVPSPLPRLEE